MPHTLVSLIGLIVIVAVCAFAGVVGGGRERVASLAFLAAVFASITVQRLSAGWDPVWPLAAVDAALLAVLAAVAWRPRRGWPVWAVALQGLTLALDGLRGADIGVGGAYTYLVAVNLSSYGLTAVIAWAGVLALRSRRG